MKYIEKISCHEWNEAFFNYFDVATKEDYWEVQGAYARPEDLCYKTTDNNCYYLLEKRQNNNFVYFARDKNRLINIKGLSAGFISLLVIKNPFTVLSSFFILTSHVNIAVLMVHTGFSSTDTIFEKACALHFTIREI